MGRLVLTYHDTGKRNSNSFVVAIRTIDHCGTSEVISPTQAAFGTGSCYGDALKDCIQSLDEYISTLSKFRDEIANTDRAYKEAIEVDFAGRQVAKHIPVPKEDDGKQFYVYEK